MAGRYVLIVGWSPLLASSSRLAHANGDAQRLARPRRKKANKEPAE
jgi:hypothetical protein